MDSELQVGPVFSRRTLAVVLAGFCAFVDLYAPQPLLPELARAFHKLPGQISLLMTISTIGVAVAAPLVGSISDRWGRKQIIVPAALLLALPTLLAATAASFAQLAFWRFWQGLLTPAVFAVTVTYVNEEWTQGAGVAMSAYVSGTVLGGFAGRSVSALVAAHFAWQWSFIALGVLNVLGGLAIWAWLPKERRTARKPPAGILADMARHLRNPQLLATYAAGFCVLFTLLGTFTYVNFYLAAPPFCLSTGALGLIFVVYVFAAVVTPVGGRWIDRLGHRVTFSMAILISISGCLLTLVPHLPAVVAGLAVFCTGIFIAQSAASAYIGIAAKSAKAAAVGLYATAYYLGGSFGSALPGLTWSWGGWKACASLMVLVSLATISLVWFSWPRRIVPPLEKRATVSELESTVGGVGD